MPDATSRPLSGEKTARRVAVASTTGAVMCGVQCVLPVALPAVALAGVGSMLAWFAGAYAWVTWVAAAAYGGAWTWIWGQSVRTKAMPARPTFVMMAVATALLALGLAWPAIERHLMRAFRGDL